jgi:hypothetical protein
VADDQLYRVDINTLAATPVTQPTPQAFRYVQKVFHTNQETYLVSGSLWQPVPERNGDGRSGALWRLREGKWERLVNGLDMAPDYPQHPFRPFLATEQGLWLGAFDVGPWFIPAGRGAPALVDWHYGYPLDGSEGLFRLADGRFLIVSANQGSIAVKQEDLLAAFQSPPEVSTLNPVRPFIQDVRGHILGLLATGDDALSDWDGKSWTDHALPGGYDPTYFWTFAADSLNRIWLLPNAFGKAVAIFDPSHQTFDIYPAMNVGSAPTGKGKRAIHWLRPPAAKSLIPNLSRRTGWGLTGSPIDGNSIVLFRVYACRSSRRKNISYSSLRAWCEKSSSTWKETPFWRPTLPRVSANTSS